MVKKNNLPAQFLSLLKIAVFSLLFLVVIGIVQCKNTFTLPQKLNVTGVGCDYIEHFNLMLDDATTQVKGSYNQSGGYYQLDGFKYFQQEVNNKLQACDVDYVTWQYSLKSMKLYRIAQNQIIVEQDSLFQNPQELELQIIFEQYQQDLQNFEDFANRRQAIVSIFFTTGYSNVASYLPDGSDMLLPFTQINWNDKSSQNVEFNPNRQLDLIQRYFFQYMGFLGKSSTTDTNTFNMYINKKKFYVPQFFVDTFFVSADTVRTSVTQPTPTQVSDTDFNEQMIKICYGTLEETIMRQNFAVWLWIVGLLVWWTVMVCTENDTESVFLDDYRDNRLTMIPLYSMYKLNNEVFFSKLSRHSLYLLYFAWQIVIISILYGQFHIDKTYDVQDAIILWYAIVAIVLAWPVGYFFGWMVYTARDQNKNKMQLEIDLKNITNKQTPEAEKLHAAIMDEENRIYTTWYVYYALVFLAVLGCILCSVWMMTFCDEETSGYWVATIFVMIFMDQIVLDSIVPFLPLISSVQKYRGYWFDADLASLWKHREEL